MMSEFSLLQAVCDINPDGLLAFDASQQVILWNKTLEGLTGLSGNDVCGQNIGQIEHPFLQHILEKSAIAMACSGQVFLSQERQWQPEKQTEPQSFQVYYGPWQPANALDLPRGGGLVSIRRLQKSVDLPEQNVLADRDASFRIMADCSPVMLWMSGRDARCIFFNRTWLEFAGRSMEDELGYGWAEQIHHEEFQYCMDTYMRAFNAHTAFSMEYRLKRFDGEYRWLLDTGRPYWDSSGNFAGFIGSCTDITALKKSKELEVEKAKLKTRVKERRAATKKLRAINRELEAFTYTVSHDLRAPLRAIIGFSQALYEDYGSMLKGEAKKYLDQIQGSAKEMGHLIEELLVFARVSRKDVVKKEIYPQELVERVIDELKSVWAGRRVVFKVASLPPCWGDPILLKQVYMNLLDNALKYSRRCAEVHIEIGWQVIDGEEAYFVKDNGAGFDMHYVDKLFTVFQRLHLAEDFEGSGLGLAIIQRIIHRHGGRVWAKGQVNAGAEFCFTLPKSSRWREEAASHAES